MAEIKIFELEKKLSEYEKKNLELEGKAAGFQEQFCILQKEQKQTRRLENELKPNKTNRISIDEIFNSM